MREKFLLGLACATTLLSCAAVPEFQVKEKWSESIRNFSVVPIYPMREDVFVGDVRLFVEGADAFSPASRALSRINLNDGLSKRYTGLPEFSKTDDDIQRPNVQTPEAANVDGAGENSVVVVRPDAPVRWKQRTTSGDDIFKPNAEKKGDRLRLASFPGLSLARVSAAEASGGGISGIWNFVVGGDLSSSAILDISVDGVESVEIDDVTAYTLIMEDLRAKIEGPARVSYLPGVCAAARRLGDEAGDRSFISVVTRVFYARSIRYTYANDLKGSLRAAAGEAAVSLPTAQNPTIPRPAPSAANYQFNIFSGGTEPFGAQGAASPSPATGTDGDTAAASVDAAPVPAQQPVSQPPTATPLSPGAGVVVGAGRRDTLVRDEIFERPMAFGVDVMNFSLAKWGVECAKVLEGSALEAGPEGQTLSTGDRFR